MENSYTQRLTKEQRILRCAINYGLDGHNEGKSINDVFFQFCKDYGIKIPEYNESDCDLTNGEADQ